MQLDNLTFDEVVPACGQFLHLPHTPLLQTEDLLPNDRKSRHHNPSHLNHGISIKLNERLDKTTLVKKDLVMAPA